MRVDGDVQRLSQLVWILSVPFGSMKWVETTVTHCGFEQTQRGVGRLKK